MPYPPYENQSRGCFVRNTKVATSVKRAQEGLEQTTSVAKARVTQKIRNEVYLTDG
jgi:hypothetical protein